MSTKIASNSSKSVSEQYSRILLFFRICKEEQKNNLHSLKIAALATRPSFPRPANRPGKCNNYSGGGRPGFDLLTSVCTIYVTINCILLGRVPLETLVKGIKELRERGGRKEIQGKGRQNESTLHFHHFKNWGFNRWIFCGFDLGTVPIALQKVQRLRPFHHYSAPEKDVQS